MSSNDNLEEIVKLNDLKKHEEGGYYNVTFTSEEIIDVSPTRYVGGKRPASSKIDYLLIENDYSAFHRLKSNEMWRHKGGTSLILYIIQKNGILKKIKIGDPSKDPEAIFEFLVEYGQWFAASVYDKTSFSFVECEVTPAFDYRDWELGKQDMLTAEYPQHTEIIQQYSREFAANNVTE